ncbi:MAG TPA: gamma-glutamyl-gamma-aminobutyrate hydrolase family protein [Pyrinomonadaceae bacterium]|nr:gamma-glutamyl-gamma-aminobutyrate hydrolase family protein [Pyrinomonadaceae bacterium]
MGNSRPLIGITTRHELDTERFYLARHYAEAVEAAGGLPVHLPLVPRGGYLGEVASRLCGLLLPGSASDVDPLLYGSEPHRRLKEVHPLRDATDLLLLGEAERSALPVLAICYGMQALNVHRGGTLIQDIHSSHPDALQHEQGAPRGRRSHSLTLLPDALLARLSGGGPAIVNSHHHQALERLGENLRATAWSADGLVEAVEDERPGRWVLGVQWHPELEWESDGLSRALFGAFVRACEEYGASVGG